MSELYHKDNVWDACTRLIHSYSGRDVDLSRLRRRFNSRKGKLFEAVNPESGRVVVPYDHTKQSGDELLQAAVERARNCVGTAMADLLTKYAAPADFEAGAVQPDSPLLEASSAVKKGMKLTRAVACLVRQVVSHFGNDEASSCANEIVNGKVASVSGFVCVSANPLDIFMASENCGWTSCHRLDGEYRAASSQFNCDSQTAVAYFFTTTRNYGPAGGASLPLKTWRQMVFFDPNRHSVAFARVYGNQIPESAHALVRREAAHALWRLLGREGSPEWTVHRKNFGQLFEADGCDGDSDPDDDGDYTRLCYLDPFNVERGCCWIAFKGEGKHPRVTLAADVPCPSCDGRMDNSGYLTCDDCRRNKYNCAGCGARTPEREVEQVGESHYCRSCFEDSFFNCPLCGENRHDDEWNDMRSAASDGHRHCCDRCTESGDARTCYCCGDLWLASDLTATGDGDRVCPECLDAHYSQCGCCDKFLEDGAGFDNDSNFCVDCHASELVAVCPGCNEEKVKAGLRSPDPDSPAVCMGCRVKARAAKREAAAANNPQHAAANSLLTQMLAAQAEAAATTAVSQ